MGDGFGIPLVIRYLLETCETVDEARATLARIPVHAAQNVTLLDASGAVVTACVGPDREPVFGDVPAATNHQREDDWPDYARAVRSVERERFALALLDDPEMSSGFGTIYTAAYHPAEGRAEYLWPGHTLSQTFDDVVETQHTQAFAEGQRAA